MLSMNHIAGVVKKLVKKHDTRDPWQICRDLQVRILYLNLHPDLKAFYFTQARCHRIVINNAIDEPLQRILIAHELGHHLEHRAAASANTFQEFELFDTLHPLEYEANLFAAELLLDDTEVIEMLNSDASFFKVARALAVPTELLDFKYRLLQSKGYGIAPLYLSSGDFLKKQPIAERLQ